MVKLVNIATAKAPISPGLAHLVDILDYKHVGSTYEGTSGSDNNPAGSATEERDVVFGNGGLDYFAGHGGDDLLYAGSNNGTWRAGDQFAASPAVNCTELTGDQGCDTLTIMKGATGSFYLDGGLDADTLVVKGGTQVGLMGGAGDDTFHFTDSFTGHAFIYDFNIFQHDHVAFDHPGSINDQMHLVTHDYGNGQVFTDTVITMASGGTVEIKAFDYTAYAGDRSWLQVG